MSAARSPASEPDTIRTPSMLRPAVLLLLRDGDSHGYELMGRLAEIGVEVHSTAGALYRSLRAMAHDGLVRSYWSTPQRGPARRVYSITERGEQHLERSMPALDDLCRTVRKMLDQYHGGS